MVPNRAMHHLFGRDIKVNSLGKILDTFNSENLLPYFQGIGSNIASDIINAVILPSSK